MFEYDDEGRLVGKGQDGDLDGRADRLESWRYAPDGATVTWVLDSRCRGRIDSVRVQRLRDGLIVEETRDKEADGTIDTFKYYEYDRERRKVREASDHRYARWEGEEVDDGIDEEALWTYDGGRLAEELLFREGELRWRTTWDYPSASTTIETQYESDETVVAIGTTLTDELARVAHHSWDGASSSELDGVLDYIAMETFDSAGRRMTFTENRLPLPNIGFGTVEVSEYDDDGRLLNRLTSSGTTIRQLEIYFYQCPLVDLSHCAR